MKSIIVTKKNDKLLTNYYFYSLKVIINGKLNYKEMIHIFGKRKEKLCQLSGDQFDTR
jgi:hypothetical protein